MSEFSQFRSFHFEDLHVSDTFAGEGYGSQFIFIFIFTLFCFEGSVKKIRSEQEVMMKEAQMMIRLAMLVMATVIDYLFLLLFIY